MNRPSLLIPHIAFPLSAVLAPAAIVLLCWCAGRLLGACRRRPSLVGRITEAKFTALLRQEGIDLRIDPRIAATVYRYLREIQGVSVPPLPEDDLVWDLGLTEGRVDETVADLARRLHRSPAPEPFARPPRTVENLARLLQGMPNEAVPVKRAA